MSWMLPDDARRRRGLPHMFAALARHQHLRSDGGAEVAVDSTGTILGATLWDPPGEWRVSRLRELRMLPGMVRAFGGRAAAGSAVVEEMRKHHPEDPHWYLAVIGTEPVARGAGHGRALMRSRLDRCDAERSPAYLESSKPENVPYYERFGFTVRDEIPLPNGGPPVWAMWREPR
ncbi:MAG: GNAT family N-acetyltransferase [Aldersonia sp.]|nr:GNAT family N-acetyltransferase [Aldersonia sp.]